ncbi:MAG: DUF1566 domain-containing protein [Treponema sp.]|nr:DUF1566 domain-containing protein [Treponema sp.]
MKKTKFIGFLAIFTVISFTMIACDADECEHIFGSDFVTPPTCLLGGFTTQTCTRCPQTRRINLTPAFGGQHIFGNDVVTPPTCLDGFTTQTCTRCPETRQINPTPAIGEHIWGSDVVTPPTCGVGGFTTQTCTTCSETRQINQTLATGMHTWGNDVVTPPTCFDGFTTQTCTRCSETRQINQTPAEHNWGNDVVTPPNCSDGFTTQTCTICHGTRQIAPTPGIGHIWNWGTFVAGSGLRECQRSECTDTAGVGDTGSGGGIIFYVRESGFTFFQNAADTTGVTRHYLEASPANLGNHQWAGLGGHTVLIPRLSQDQSDPTDWAIGRGMKNTQIIIAHGIENSYTTDAATAAQGLGEGWFLPSRNELNALWQNRAVVDNLEEVGWFWSSSQLNSLHAWVQSFLNGSQDDFAQKTNNFVAVRAVRAF